MSEVGDILTKALEILDERGWCQNKLENDDGSVCAFGAINTVMIGRAAVGLLSMPLADYCAQIRCAEPVAEALNRHLPEGWSWFNVEAPRSRVVDYNNAKTTTAEDIKDLFKRTIYDEEQK